jgi:hypothetical protein
MRMAVKAYHNIYYMCKKIAPLTTPTLPLTPIFRPFSAFQSKSYIKKTALKIWRTLESIDLTAPTQDIEEALNHQRH